MKRSIQTFLTVVAPQREGQHIVQIRTPLQAMPESDVGWLTLLTFATDKFAKAFDKVCHVSRFTCRVKQTRGGLKRNLKWEPGTSDTFDVSLQGVETTTKTRWQRESDYRRAFTRSESWTPRLSFDPQIVRQFIERTIETGEGSPLCDWLCEETTEFGPMISAAGWLPKDWDGMEAEMDRRQRVENEKLNDRWR